MFNVEFKKLKYFFETKAAFQISPGPLMRTPSVSTKNPAGSKPSATTRLVVVSATSMCADNILEEGATVKADTSKLSMVEN